MTNFILFKISTQIQDNKHSCQIPLKRGTNDKCEKELRSCCLLAAISEGCGNKIPPGAGAAPQPQGGTKTLEAQEHIITRLSRP